jgi:hypothetical protein
MKDTIQITISTTTTEKLQNINNYWDERLRDANSPPKCETFEDIINSLLEIAWNEINS